MPPIRNAPSVKPQKTERTHEENQERAYIAASRRSDRSLEARIESARRASEIHKKRTGRALRVTEQDVINEEMYEEEDDLPSSYRRFAQHLQHNNLSLDCKFESYMIANLATRQAMLNQYWSTRDNPNSPQNYPIMSQNAPMPVQAFRGQPMSPQYANPPYFAPQNVPPSTAVSPIQVKQAAQSSYPPRGNQFVPQRSASISIPQSSAYPANLHSVNQTKAISEEQRRMSLPVQPLQNVFVKTPMNEAGSQQQPTDQIPFSFQASALTHSMDFGPLSTSLPLNQQQIAGCALNPMSPSTQFLMAGSEGTQALLYNSDPNAPAKSADINQTLASNPLDTTPSTETNLTFPTIYSPQSANTVECFQSPAWSPNQPSYDFNDGIGDFKPIDFNQFFNATPTGGTQTPSNFDFSSYINISGSGNLADSSVLGP